MPIYNYVSSVENPLTWGQFTDLNIKNGFEYPFSSAIWYISFHMHKTAFMNRIYMLFLHILPALLIDAISICVGQRPRLLKMYKKIHKFSSVISFFCTNEWVSGEFFFVLMHSFSKFIPTFFNNHRCLQTQMFNDYGKNWVNEIKKYLILISNTWIG